MKNTISVTEEAYKFFLNYSKEAGEDVDFMINQALLQFIYIITVKNKEYIEIMKGGIGMTLTSGDETKH